MLIYPYKPGSKGGKALAKSIGAKRIKHKGSRFRGGPNKTVINWGATELPEQVTKCKVINPPEAVLRAADKLQFFKAMEGQDLTPAFCTGLQEASEWVSDGKIVVCRTMLRANSGRGIVIAEKEDELVHAPLYVEYIKKKEEYRVHVYKGDCFDIQRKARRADTPDEQVNWRVRNHDNGFIFAREGVNESPYAERLHELARNSCCVLGLDFGAVDIIWNERRERGYVLEVNTAPGLEGTTLEKYLGMIGGIE